MITKEQYYKVVKDFLEEEIGEVVNICDDSYFSDIGIDSLDMADLVCHIEEELDINIGYDAIYDCHTIGQLYDTIKFLGR